jgi:uncharacterized protein
MNAPNPLSSEKRNAERKVYEPSMDEILASIRRIIADDQAFLQKKPSAPRPLLEPRGRIEPTIRPSVRPPPSPRTSAYGEARPAQPAPGFAVEAQFQPFKTAGLPEPEPETTAPGTADWEADPGWIEEAGDERAARAQTVEPETPLISPQTDAAVSSSFSALAAAQVLPSDEELDEMVREMIRPMLKAWLDDNLPVLVERLVRAEIERVARGGR